jgi:hypothetical protein
VSDCSTVTNIVPVTEVTDDRSFSWKINLTDRIPEGHLYIATRVQPTRWVTSFRIYLERLSCCLYPKPIMGLQFQSSHSISDISSTGILTCYPSDTLFSLSLGPTNPWLTDIAMETLDIRRTGFSPVFRYSSQHSHFYTLQQLLTGHLHSYLSTAKSIMYRTLPYPSIIPRNYLCRSFGIYLQPRYILSAKSLD